MSKYPGAQDRRSLERRIISLERKLAKLEGGTAVGLQAARDLTTRYADGRFEKFIPNPGTVGTTELASTIHAVQIVSSLPVLPDPNFDYIVGESHVYLTQDDGANLGGRLYKCIAATGVPDDDWQYIVDAELIDGLIDGAQIKEDTIAAKNIIVTDWANLLNDPFLADPGAWTTAGAVTFINLAQGDPAATGAKLDGDGLTAASLTQAAFAIGEGEVLSAILTAKALGAPPNLEVVLECFDGGAVSLGQQVMATFTSADTAWTKRSGEVTTPTGTVTAQVFIRHTATVAAGNSYTVTRAVVRRAAAGNLIVDGEISARHLAADAVVAGTIAAGAIRTRELSADTIEVTNAERLNAALSFLNSLGEEVLRIGNIASKNVGKDYGLWGALGSGVFIEGAPRLIAAGSEFEFISTLSFDGYGYAAVQANMPLSGAPASIVVPADKYLLVFTAVREVTPDSTLTVARFDSSTVADRDGTTVQFSTAILGGGHTYTNMKARVDARVYRTNTAFDDNVSIGVSWMILELDL